MYCTYMFMYTYLFFKFVLLYHFSCNHLHAVITIIYFQINPIDILAAQGGEVRNSGNADIALANKKWKWPSLNPSSVGMASLISDRYMYMFMILLQNKLLL